MRYIKLFFFVFVFFMIMIFFVQNMAPFSQQVALKLDFMFMQPIETTPIPMYSIIVIAFTVGALLVLLMLMWDRVALSTRVSRLNSKATNLEKKLAKTEASLAAITAKSKDNEELLITENNQLKTELSDTREKLDELRQSYSQ